MEEVERKPKKEEEEGRERGKRRRRMRRTGVILHSSGVCLDKSSSGRAEDYGIMVTVFGHVSWRGRH